MGIRTKYFFRCVIYYYASMPWKEGHLIGEVLKGSQNSIFMEIYFIALGKNGCADIRRIGAM